MSMDDDGGDHGHGAAAADQHGSDVRLLGLQRGTTLSAALAFYDGLELVGLDDMIGSWRGEGLPTGHPFDGLLETLGWHGKRFDAPDRAHPLVFDAGSGRRVSVNPAFVPVAVMVRHPRLLHTPLAARLFSVIRPFVATRKPKARLRLTQYRGVVTATMCYDGTDGQARYRLGPRRPGRAARGRPRRRSCGK